MVTYKEMISAGCKLQAFKITVHTAKAFSPTTYSQCSASDFDPTDLLCIRRSKVGYQLQERFFGITRFSLEKGK